MYISARKQDNLVQKDVSFCPSCYIFFQFSYILMPAKASYFTNNVQVYHLVKEMTRNMSSWDIFSLP